MRTGIEGVILDQKNCLKEALHTASFAVPEKQQKLNEENQRLEFVNTKVAKKTASDRRVVQEYDGARDVLLAAQAQASSGNTREQKDSLNSFLLTCESLVNSWEENLQTSKTSLSSREFKSQRQGSVVTRSTNKLRAAKTKASDTKDKIHLDRAHLQIVFDLLDDLQSDQAPPRDQDAVNRRHAEGITTFIIVVGNQCVLNCMLRSMLSYRNQTGM